MPCLPIEKKKKKLAAHGSHRKSYRAIQNLKSHDRPNYWSINELQPEISDEELAEDHALFFNKISDEFTPLRDDDIPSSHSVQNVYLMPHEVSSRLKHFKKPKSMVEGDLFPQCVTEYSDLLTVPLTKIYNLIIASGRWPKCWKMETVTVIPKNKTANTYGECRNLSCTPLFSKVMESFLMKRINKEVKIDANQYGGMKNAEPNTSLFRPGTIFSAAWMIIDRQ